MSPPVETKEINDNERDKARKEMFQIGNKDVSHDIYCMIKSRFRVLYICTSEEVRVLNYFKCLSTAEAYELFQWDIGRGLLDGHSLQPALPDGNDANTSPEAILRHIVDRANSDFQKIVKKQKPQGSIFVLLDFHRFLQSDDGQSEGHPIIQRLIKQFCQIVSSAAIIIVAPVLACPVTLEKEMTVIDFPFPSSSEISNALKKLSKQIPTEYPKAKKQVDELQEELIKSVSGLTLVEAENAFARSLIKKKSFDINEILNEKKQVIRKSGMLEYRDSRYSFNDIGGLDNLRDWIITRRLALKDEATEFGLPLLRGILILGSPGTGKSMACDAIASAYGIPLLRLDFGSIFASYVGHSERNIRKCIQIAEHISPCVLWLDEIDKGISGTTSSEHTDGGVTARVFGTLLTWMQEKEKLVFVACTANNVFAIPPEFMRAGRFDEVFFLDLPNEEQRCDVIEKLLLKKKRNPDEFDINLIVGSCKNYSPAEIEKGIDNALFVAFADAKRALTTEDIVSEMAMFAPLYNSRKEEIEGIRNWALGNQGIGGRARLANASSKHKPKITKHIDTSNVTFDLDLDI